MDVVFRFKLIGRPVMVFYRHLLNLLNSAQVSGSRMIAEHCKSDLIC